MKRHEETSADITTWEDMTRHRDEETFKVIGHEKTWGDIKRHKKKWKDKRRHEETWGDMKRQK